MVSITLLIPSCHGLDSIRYFEPKFWYMIPFEIKECKDIKQFEAKIQDREPNGY